MAQKRKHENGDMNNEPKKKPARVFNFGQHPKRKIAIQFLYYGWEHEGLVQQLNTENTVENHLMKALMKTCLIESWETCDVSRCGRTDKGVSAFKQTIALVVRSNDVTGDGVFWEEGTSDSIKESYPKKQELGYVKMLNGVLPASIRAFRWAPVGKDFNARFDCNQRIYKYALPKANLDVEKMRTAAGYLIGEHDFSNFCQIDMNVKRLEQSYIRRIYDVKVDLVVKNSTSEIYDLIELTVIGSGFLWHMIRYIVTILHEVGRGNENPEIVKELLDLEKYSSRPQYTLASDTPLCLFDCRYDNLNIKWNTDNSVLNPVVAGLQKQWAVYQSRGRMMENMISELSNMSENVDVEKGLLEFVQDRPIPAKYVKFGDRPKCESLKDKREKLKQKMED